MRPTFGPLLVLIATWLFPAVAMWGQLNCASCNPQFLEVESSTLDTSCTAGNALDLLPDFLDYTTDCPDGFSTAVAKFPLGNERICNGNRPAEMPYFLGTVHLHNFESTGLANGDAFLIDSDGATWTKYSDSVATFEGRVINGSNPTLQFRMALVLELPTTGATWMAQGGNINLEGSNTSEAQDWDIWQVKPLLSKFIGINGLDGKFLLVQNSSVDVSHPFQVGTNAHGFATGSEGIAGNFGWSTCVGSVVYGGFGEVSVEFNACQQQTSYCASDLDAVAHYFVGNLHSYQETTRTVDVTDNTPPSFLTLPSNLSLECPTATSEALSIAPLEAIDDCSQWTLDSSTTTIPGICPQEMRLLTTYTLRDACGHVVEHLREVDITDPHAPELTVPDDVVFGCNEELVYEDAFAVDACEGALTVVELTPLVLDGECPSNYTVIRTFVATDGCGNDTTASQSVEVRDLEPPSFTMPEDVLLDCAGPENYP